MILFVRLLAAQHVLTRRLVSDSVLAKRVVGKIFVRRREMTNKIEAFVRREATEATAEEWRRCSIGRASRIRGERSRGGRRGGGIIDGKTAQTGVRERGRGRRREEEAVSEQRQLKEG